MSIPTLKIFRCSFVFLQTQVPEAETEGGGSPWFVLNDFMVRNVSEDEALSFSGKWKVRMFPAFLALYSVLTMRQVPCVLFLEREDPDPQLDFSGLPLVASRSILQRRITIAPLARLHSYPSF